MKNNLEGWINSRSTECEIFNIDFVKHVFIQEEGLYN